MSRKLFHSIIYQGWLTLALLIILFALYIAVGRQFMPVVGHYREDIQRIIGTQWGVQVQLGSLAGSWAGFEPSLELHDIVVTFPGAPGERPAFRLARASLTLDSLRSILRRGAVFQDVELTGLRLSLKQEENGWSLPGVAFGGSAGSPDPGGLRAPIDWLLAQARARLIDAQASVLLRTGERLDFAVSELGIFRRGDRHRLLGTVRADSEFGGGSLELRAETFGDPFQPADFFASFYVDLAEAHLAHPLFKEQLPILHLAELHGAATIWGYWREGRLDYLLGDVRLPESTWVAGGDRLRIPIRDAGGQLIWRASTPGKWSVELNDIKFAWGDHQSHISRLRLARFPEEGRLRVSSDRLALGPFNRFLLATPVLPERLATVLADLAVTGSLENIQIDHWTAADAPRKFRIRANLRDVEAAAWAQAPSLSRINGYLESDERRGFVDLDTSDAVLAFPRLFEKGWQLAHARGRVGWSVDLPMVQVRSGLLALSPPGANLRGRFRLWLPQDGRDPSMSLALGITEGEGARTASFLPSKIMGQGASDWLGGAVREGDLRAGSYVYHGVLGDPTGSRFSSIMHFDVGNGRIRFLPDWPEISAVEALVVGDARAYTVHVDSGSMLDSRIREATVRLPREQPGDPRIHIDAQVQHALPAAVRLLRETPLAEYTPAQLDQWAVKGNAPTRLKLDVTLSKETDVRVRADLNLQDASLVIPQGEKQLKFSAIRGALGWSTRKGLVAERLRTRFLGRPATVRIQTQPGQETQVRLSSRVDMARLTAFTGAKILSFATGELPYQAELRVPYDGTLPMLDVHSSLEGVAIEMPPPLAKPAAAALPTTVRLRFGKQEDRLYLYLRDLLRGRLYQQDGVVTRGILQFGPGAQMEAPLAGLRIGGELRHLDFAEWQAFLPELNARTADAVEGGDSEALVQHIDFRFGNLRLFGYDMPDSVLAMRREPGAWRLDLDNPMLELSAKLPHDENLPLDLHLHQLKLPAPDQSLAGDPLQDIDPRALPGLNVQLDSFFLGEHDFGGWSFQSRASDTGLEVTKVKGRMREMVFQKGRLAWDYKDGAHRTAVKTTAHVADMADVLRAWAFEPTLDSDSGAFWADVEWPASPVAFDLGRARGELGTLLKDGRFIEVKPGPLRVFGILNINTIARRLRLDFSDLFGKGLQYDKIEGRYRLSDGILHSLGTMDIIGPSNKFYISGRINLLEETLDQKLTLTVPLTSNLPFAAIIAGAPYLAGAIFLTEKLLGDRLERFASAQYSIKGNWNDPEVKLEKMFSGKD